mmetsp:Transcript_28838/g.63542  ORF Transcript_28838/g.63542 Transcript_28838/m.63542 type:complete len:469 (+) Transcript_28838:271-1677(+)
MDSNVFLDTSKDFLNFLEGISGSLDELLTDTGNENGSTGFMGLLCSPSSPRNIAWQEEGAFQLSNALGNSTGTSGLDEENCIDSVVERPVSRSITSASEDSSTAPSSAQTRPDQPTDPSNTCKRTRKKRTNKHAELKRELQQRMKEAEALEAANDVLKRRQRLLAALISVRDGQMSRIKQLATGQTPCDFPKYFNGASIDEVRGWSQKQLSAVFMGHLAIITQQLSAATPEKHGELMTFMEGLMEAGRYASLANPHVLHMSGLHIESHLPALVAESSTSGAEGASSSSSGRPSYPPWGGTESLEPQRPQMVADEAHWQQVLSALQLDPGQQTDFCLLHDVHSKLMSKVRQERAVLAKRLEELLQGAGQRYKLDTGGSGSGAGAGAGPSLVTETGHVAEIMEMDCLVEKLGKSMVKERCLSYLVSEVVFGKLIRTEQMVNLAVATYPYIPNHLAMLSTVAQAAAAKQGQ